MTRLLWLAALLLCLLAVLAKAQSAPTNCTFPTTVDSFRTFHPGEVIPSADENKQSCILDKLMRRQLRTRPQEKLCQSAVTLGPSVRQMVTLTTTQTFSGLETVLPQPPIDAAISPPAVIVDGLDPATGTSIKLWLFNRDADRTRTVQACVSVERP
jgi:hypothetical protein